MAYDVYKDRTILELASTEKLQYDWGNRKEAVSVEEAKDAFEEYYELIQFLEDWDRGTFLVTYVEYFTLPAILLDFKRLHKSLIGASRGNK